MGVPKKNDILHRFVYKRVDAIFTSSRELNDRLPALYPVDPAKIHFLPYGRILDRYERSEARRTEIRQSFGVSGEEILAGTMIRIDPGKGAMDFARSFSYIDPSVREIVKYVIVGEPTRKGRAKSGEPPFEDHCVSYLRDLEAFIAGEGLSEKVILAGYQNDVVGYLSAMDLFVFPSRDELYSLVVLDAMSMGLPVVAARAGGTLYQVEEGKSGLFYEVADSRDAAAKISTYARSPEMRQLHGRAAREFVERNHAMSSTVAALMAFYRQER
jgi:glycosyltransferase involved in cell wall biosynthesis